MTETRSNVTILESPFTRANLRFGETPDIDKFVTGVVAVRDDHPSAWLEHRACANTPTEVFFAERFGRATEAYAVCARCPVWAQCLNDAVSRNEVHGIWGGCSPKTRRKVRARLRRAQVA